LEPLQILLDNPSNSLKVTPIISEAEGNEEGNGEASAPLVQAKKSAVELVLSTPEIKAESGTTKKTLSMQKTESKHNPPRATIPKGQSGRSKSENFKAIKSEFPKVDIYRRSDYSSFIRFFANVKTKVIMPDRWGINGVMFDPVRKMKTFTMAELEISPIGETRVKKCIQVNSYSSQERMQVVICYRENTWEGELKNIGFSCSAHVATEALGSPDEKRMVFNSPSQLFCI